MLSTISTSSSILSPSHPQTCRMTFTPLKGRRRISRTGHGSLTIQQSKHTSTMDHAATKHGKRASIYVSDASIILAQRAPIISPASSCSPLSPTSETTVFADHYAILQLQPGALDHDIISSFRRLRAVYFQNDATKYKALTIAFDVLRDPEARQTYDMQYYPRAALPMHMPSTGNVSDRSKHERTDSVMDEEATGPVILRKGEEVVRTLHKLDPNQALKRHQQFYEPLHTTARHQSYIPVLTAREARSNSISSTCRKSTSIPQMARNSRLF